MIWLKRILGTLFVLILVLIAAIAALLYTPAGVKVGIWGAEKALPNFSVKSTSGSLLNGFSLEGIQLQEQGVKVVINSLSLKLNDKCLLTPKVCIEALTANGVNVDMPTLPPTSPKVKDETPLTTISLPIPVTVNQLALDNIKLNILGNQIAWKHFSTSASVTGSHVILNPTLWQNISVTLAPESKTKPSVKKKEPKKSTADITLPNITLPMSFEIKPFTIQNFELKGSTPQTIQSLILAGHAQGDKIALSQLDIVAPQANLKATANVQLANDYPLTLNALLDVKMKPYQGNQLNLKVSGSAANLIIDGQLKGKIDAALKGNISPLKSTLPFDVSLKSHHLQWPLVKPQYQLKQTDLSAKGSLDGFTFAIKTQAKGTSIPSLALVAKGKGDLSSIALQNFTLKTLGGSVSGSAGANWKNLVTWQGKLALKTIQPGLQWPQAKGILNGNLVTSGGLTAQGGWFVHLPQLAITGELMGQVLRVKGQLDASDPNGKLTDIKAQTSGLSVHHGVNGLDIRGTLDKTWNMTARLNAPNLGKSIPNAGGEVSGDINIQGKMMEPQIQLALQGANLKWEKSAYLKNFSINGNVSPLPVPQANLSIKAQEGHYNAETLKSLDIEFHGTEKSHHLSINMQAKPVSVNLTASGDFDPKTGWKGALNQATIETPIGPWKLNGAVPISYDLSSGMAKVAANCWTHGDASICLVKDLEAGKSGEAQLAIKNLSFNIIKPFLPSNLSLVGGVGADVTARWSPTAAPYVNAVIKLPEGSVTQQQASDGPPLVVGWNSAQINAIVDNNTLNANWLLDLTRNGSITGQATVTNLTTTKTLKANLNINAITLGFLDPIVAQYSNMNGEVNANLQLSGALLHPAVTGKLTVSKVVATGMNVPLDVTNANVIATFTGYQALLSGDVETPDGHLILSGNANWQDLAKWNALFNVKGNSLRVSVPPMVSMYVSPNLTIKANATSAEITGKVVLPKGLITVDELPKSAVKVSSDQIILNGNLQPLVKKESNPFDLKTNILVVLGDDVRISAFGFKGRLAGEMSVQQNNKGPLIYGEVNIKDGEYRALGQDLLIKKGQIIFNGPANQPYLSIEAIRDPDSIEDDVTAGLRITGPASAPKVSIFSKPAMPQQNALSYLLQGRNLDLENNDGNDDAMTTALIGLGLAQTSQLVGSVGEAVGVKDLSLSTSGAGTKSQIAVSGYIAPGLQVKYGVGIFNSLAEFTVRYRLMQNFYVQAVSGLNSAVDLLYKFQFN